MVLKSCATKSGMTKSILSLLLAASVMSPALPETDAWACSDSPLLGSICVVTYARGCPSGFVQADGRLLSIGQYSALFSLIGVKFGGDGRTTFAVPDLRGREPVGVGPATQVTSAVALGQYRGQESVVLNPNNVPAHTHGATFTPTTGSVPVTIPAQAASGAINATATTAVVPGSSGIDPLPNVSSYYLTGVSGPAANGPVTTSKPGSDMSTLAGTSVEIDSTTYKAATAGQTVNINTVTGGSITVTPTSSSGQPVITVPPQLGLYYCIATTGTYPMFD